MPHPDLVSQTAGLVLLPEGVLPLWCLKLPLFQRPVYLAINRDFNCGLAETMSVLQMRLSFHMLQVTVCHVRLRSWPGTK